MLRQEAELGGHLPLELAKVRWDVADSLRQRPPGQLCRRSDVGRLCRLLSPDSLSPHPLTALRFENSLLSLISERPLQQLSSSVSGGMPVILTCLGVSSEGVHILQGSSLLVGGPCQLLGPL